MGCAEGYTTALVRELFHAQVAGTDLSAQVCRLANNLYGLDTQPSDIHHLPFGNKAYDVVLCSETIEHVTDYRQAITELLRVTKKTLVITVPHEPLHIVEHNRSTGVIAGHIHAFDLKSLDYLKEQGYSVVSKKLLSPFIKLFGVLVEAAPKTVHDNSKFPKWIISTYNSLLPFLQKLLGVRSLALLLHLDGFLCKILGAYEGIVFTVTKDPSSLKSSGSVSAQTMIHFSIPLYYLKK